MHLGASGLDEMTGVWETESNFAEDRIVVAGKLIDLFIYFMDFIAE